ncbi:RNA polymerase sigma factor [Candidatus Kaiserbacteria bacterium]|nr:RNA polymerase sigma factor [Candidatus Kaiserbacteria bacterium]
MESDTIKNKFINLYHNESDSVFRFCLLRTSDAEVAVDIMQDTFMRFWNALSRGGKEIRNERAFLFSIARNGIIDWYRKKKPVSLESLAEEAETDAEAFMDTAQKEDIEMEHEAKLLMEKIRELEPLYQQAVYLRFVEDFRPKEIAEILGETTNAVSVRIHRGVRQLRKLAGYDEK